MKKGLLGIIVILSCFFIKQGNALVDEYTPSMQEEYNNYEYVILEFIEYETTDIN